jgi:hypothetical protein
VVPPGPPDADTGRVFILYAIPVGLVAGWLLGGPLAGLVALRIRLAWLAVAAVAVQIALFSPPAEALGPDLARALYVASTAAVVVAVATNLRLTGMPIVLAGSVANLVAIAANGGSMPADPDALAAVGIRIAGPTNSVVVDRPALAPLTDVFATPAWLPFANVFSVGDVLIGCGLAVVIAAAMRRARAGPAGDKPARGSGPA